MEMRLDRDDITGVLFYPRTEDEPTVNGIATVTRVDDAQLGGCFHANDSSSSLLIFFHGNGEIAVEYDALAGMFKRSGVNFWVVDYRGYTSAIGEHIVLTTA